IADEWIAYYWPIVEADVVSDAAAAKAGSAAVGRGAAGGRRAPSPEAPAILQGQKIKGKNDFAFRAGLTGLASRFAGAGGHAAFSRSRDAGRLSAEAEALYRRTMSKLKAAIGQPVQYAGNERTTKGLFEMKGDYVILPGALWSELSVMGRWVIDSISLRWADFTIGLRHQMPGLTRDAVLALLLPADDADRDVAVARAAFDRRREESSDGRIECVWSGQRVARFDVDHAIPFALWGNNDLWNLLPAARAINNAKRTKLPERFLIERRHDAIVEAWEMLYESERGLFLAHAGSFTGHSWGDFGRREEEELFSTFKDAVEYTARNRVAERWAG
ncbi:MAG: HNH endonuclease domain-containing protein, partial [Rhodothermales bacterium]